MLIFGAGGGQRIVATPKTSSHARFQGLVVTRERLQPQKRAVMLVFRAGDLLLL